MLSRGLTHGPRAIRPWACALPSTPLSSSAWASRSRLRVSVGGVQTAGARPSLPYEEWRETRDTLHMYTQVIGKLRLALSPFEPEWAHVPLYVSARGLTTSTVPVGLRTIDAELDLIDHALVVRSSDGDIERRP